MGHVLSRERFADFDQYREHLRCWDTEAVQLSPGALSIGCDCLDAGDVILMRLNFQPAAIFKSARDPGWYTFILDSSPKRWCGIDVPAKSFRTIAPQRETNVVSHHPWNSLCITVQRDTMAAWGSPLSDLADWTPVPEQSLFASDRIAIEAFKAWADTLFSTPMPLCSEDDAALWIAAIREHVRQHLLAVLGCKESPEPLSAVHRVARYDLALAALRRIDPHTEGRVTVRGLAQCLGVSARALEYAFLGVIGVSPARYLLAERLNRARHQLRIRGPVGGSVTAVAFDHQFDNLSRFAQQYARLFGERPSETLRSARDAFHHA